MRQLAKALIVVLIIGGLGAGGWYWYKEHQKQSAPAFRTVQVKRGDLVATIGATGTVEPEEVVDVGAQVAGQILSFGKDAAGKPVDYLSPVEQGMVLAKIDDSLYAADVASSKAQVLQSDAGEASAEANVLQMNAKLEQAQQDWDRAQKLGPSEALRRRFTTSTRPISRSPRRTLRCIRRPWILQGHAGAGQGQPDACAAEPGLLHDQVARQGRDHRPPREYRADGRLQPQRAEPVPHRQGPDAHTGLGVCK